MVNYLTKILVKRSRFSSKLYCQIDDLDMETSTNKKGNGTLLLISKRLTCSFATKFWITRHWNLCSPWNDIVPQYFLVYSPNNPGKYHFSNIFFYEFNTPALLKNKLHTYVLTTEPEIALLLFFVQTLSLNFKNSLAFLYTLNIDVLG